MTRVAYLIVTLGALIALVALVALIVGLVFIPSEIIPSASTSLPESGILLDYAPEACRGLQKIGKLGNQTLSECISDTRAWQERIEVCRGMDLLPDQTLDECAKMLEP